MMRFKHLFSTVIVVLFAVVLAAYSHHTLVESKKDSTGYTHDPATEYLVTQYADATGVQGTFYTITNDTTLIIIDGGWADNAAACARSSPPTGTMSTPGFSHIRIRITPAHSISPTPHRTASRSTPSTTMVSTMTLSKRPESRTMTITVMETYHTLTQDASNVTHLHRGDVLSICGLTFSVLNAYDDTVLQNVGDEKDYQNNASLLLKVSSVNSSMLFCSDIKYDMNDSLLAACKDQLACDYVQTGHHGNWSFSEEFYDATGASVYFIDAPSSITDNADFPASTLKSDLLAKGKTVLDFSTAPNTVTLK